VNALAGAVAEALVGTAFRQFICRVCGLIYDEALGDADSGLAAGTRWEDIPEDWACPICGVGKADFELCAPASAGRRKRPARASAPGSRPAAVAGQSRREAGVVIVGAGRAGWQVAQALREKDAGLPITLVSACVGEVYDKPMLSVAVARALPLDSLVRETAAQAAQRLGLRLLTDTHVLRIDAAAQRLRTTRGVLPYRHLVLAHGAEPMLPGALPARHVWRINDLHSYRRLRAALAGAPRRLVLVGAGLVGCELANDLALAGHHISLLDVQALPLAAQLPAQAGLRLLEAWRGLPIRFLGGVQVSGVTLEPDAPHPPRYRVSLTQGEALQADQVIAATGLRAPGRLAASAGLAYDSAAGGIVADPATMRTSAPGIYALGDCVSVHGRASRYIAPIAGQAQAIAASILGQARTVSAPVSADESAVLRVKTSALPIMLSGRARPGLAWHTERDDDTGLRMHQRNSEGVIVASLVTSPPGRAAAAA
jgi:rubredoxin-NAD+ reductase